MGGSRIRLLEEIASGDASGGTPPLAATQARAVRVRAPGDPLRRQAGPSPSPIVARVDEAAIDDSRESA
jgi:hypothetical protein